MSEQNKSEERPYSVELSAHEIAALAKWHLGQMNKISRLFGKQALSLGAGSPFGGGRQLVQLKLACEAKVKQHELRARGLISLIQ